MHRRVVELSLAVMLSAAAAGVPMAAEENEQHHHNQRENHGQHDTHRHLEWLTPPSTYAGKISHRWGDEGAIGRGRPIYDAHCSVCHGADGRGTTAVGRTLPHPPADLSHHFHPHPGAGDAYLYWRVSEGGTVEPFNSAGSLMPAFSQVLSEDEIWDVLAYVCAVFHLGFE